LRLGRKPGRRRLRTPLPPWRRPLSFLFHHPVGANDCRCASPIIAGESGNGSARCDGDRRHPPSSIHAMMLAGARLSPLWASPGAALRGVAATGTFLPPSRRCAPPTIVGESRNGSTCCGGGRPPSSSRRGRWPVRASHQCRRVRERLCMVWQRSAPSPLRPGMDACRCVPPTDAGENDYSPAWCGGCRHPLLSPSRRGRLPMCASHHCGRVRERLCMVWWQPTPSFLRLGKDACRCAPPTDVAESDYGSTWCGGGRHPLLSPSRRGRLPVRASHHCGRVRERLRMV
jgi:hypothetical protein